MKTILTALASLIGASAALAHADALPHLHQASQVSWLPAMLCLAALFGATAALLLRGRARKER